MKLRTLGALGLEGGSLRARQPLLLLAYLSLSGKELRSEIADVFWPHLEEREARLRSLGEVLRRLRRALPAEAVEVGPRRVRVAIPTDVEALLGALERRSWGEAVALYRGPFLAGLERDGRMTIGVELEEWIVSTREALRARVSGALLGLAEEAAFRERFRQGAELARRAQVFEEGVSFPTAEEFRRLHTLLLAFSRQEAEALERGAREVYGELALLGSQHEARVRLLRVHGLPPPAGELIGREGELAQLLALLGSARLVTVAGMPGVGKTALAVAAAWAAREEFEAGVRYAALDDLPVAQGAGELVRVLQEAWGFRERNGSLEALAGEIGRRRVLLVLDGFERQSAQAGVLAELLRRCPQAVLLVTSREVLRLREERVLRLRGLAFPTQEDDPGAADTPAVRLFVERSRQWGAATSAAELPQVARIARLVEGLPLALELAAALTGVRPAVVAERLAADGGLELLGAGARDTPAHHRSLRAAFEVSWRLLPARLQEAFARLGVFCGAFDREVAAEVAGVALTELEELTERSLLRYQRLADRYDLHALLRAYALEKLAALEPGAEAAVRDRHARYFLARLADPLRPDWGALRRGGQQWRDVAAAWAWAVERGWLAEVARGAHGLERFFDETARQREGLRLFEEAEAKLREQGAASADHAQVAAVVAVSRAWLLFRLCRYEEAGAVAGEALPALRQGDDVRALRGALTVLGASLDSLGCFEEARPAFEEAMHLDDPDGGFTATAQANLGWNALKRGEYPQALIHFRHAQDAFQRLRRYPGLAHVALGLGDVHLALGQFDRARRALEDGLEIAEAYELEHWRGVLASRLAAVALAEGKTVEALRLCRRTLVLARKQAKHNLEAYVVRLLGDLARQRGALAQAERYYRRSLSFYAEHNDVLNLLAVLARLAAVWAASGDHERAAALGAVLNLHLGRMVHVERERFEAWWAGIAVLADDAVDAVVDLWREFPPASVARHLLGGDFP